MFAMKEHQGASSGSAGTYRGRLAPSPTGFLHLGHARTFWKAQQRARERDGVLVLRNEDLDPARSRSEFAAAMSEDMTRSKASSSECSHLQRNPCCLR